MAWPPTTHQDVEDDLTDGHGWAGSLTERFGLGELQLGTATIWTAGRYYAGATTAIATSTGTMSANRLYLTPLYFPAARSVDLLAINVSTAGTASHVARLGIYNSAAGTGLPTTVKVDAGTVAVDSTGVKTLSISSTLTGLVWLAVTSQSGSATGTVPGGAAPIGGASSATGALGSCLTRDSAAPTSSLPDLTGDATVVPNAPTVVPRVMVRAA